MIKKNSVVIVPKIPTDALRNLSKLERRAGKPLKMAKISPQARRLSRSTPEAKTLRIIYRDEGADACLRCCKHFKQSRREMLLLLAAFEAESEKSKRA